MKISFKIILWIQLLFLVILYNSPGSILLYLPAILLIMFWICIPIKIEHLGAFFEIHYPAFNRCPKIYQKKLSQTDNCRFHEFCTEAKRLPEMLPKGKYITITHDMILERIKKNTTVTKVRQVKIKNLEKNSVNMFGCKTCDKESTCIINTNKIKSFYKVWFEKE